MALDYVKGLQKKQYTPEELDYLLNGYALEKQKDPEAMVRSSPIQTPNPQTAPTPTVPVPQVAPTPTIPPVPTPVPKPDIAQPFRQPETTEVTQSVGENPNSWQYGYGPQGHEGVDMINPNLNVTNPIGGINVTGNSPQGYGNWQVVVGANPQELNQMDPQTEAGIRQQIADYMLNNPADIRSLDIPGKNISIQSHLADPAPADTRIATGSADLTMGGTGGWAPHLHSALKNTQGEMVNILKEIKRRAGSR